MQIREPGFTARDAADYFAREAFAEQRKVGEWENVAGSSRHHHCARFRLIGGRQWYGVWMLADYSGFSVEAETLPV